MEAKFIGHFHTYSFKFQEPFNFCREMESAVLELRTHYKATAVFILSRHHAQLSYYFTIHVHTSPKVFQYSVFHPCQAYHSDYWS